MSFSLLAELFFLFYSELYNRKCEVGGSYIIKARTFWRRRKVWRSFAELIRINISHFSIHMKMLSQVYQMWRWRWQDRIRSITKFLVAYSNSNSHPPWSVCPSVTLFCATVSWDNKYFSVMKYFQALKYFSCFYDSLNNLSVSLSLSLYFIFQAVK